MALEWKNNLVLIAKNTPVWLYQLSKKYNQDISHLDHIPDEELVFLRDFGITGLWLIGIWERSPASEKIKNLYGNYSATASAYAIHQYVVAENLGGEPALSCFQEKAHRFGLHVGCDMVPNHTGIDAPWVVDHPDWFIQTDSNPSPEFVYQSPDLSPADNIGIHLEEGYYQKIKASEVFLYTDKNTHQDSYIFHGNDGTSMPWNDTAQLDYTNPETRSAVIETILRLAQKFEIIRLDAAMTLTKEHFKRLWFPDKNPAKRCIPYRENTNLTDAEFDEIMPNEFWEDVINAIEKLEHPPLFIAEAFWLMEGFFINKLKMHRVYNSAFMNFLQEEDNASFRRYMKEIIQNNPENLSKFVNYLTTPDEQSAATLFGCQEKYFGTLAFMVSIPGLLLLGHGQLEGFYEKYAMDFSKPQRNEVCDQNLIEKHKQRIAPLLQLREYFSLYENFAMYDFNSTSNIVDENIISLSNSRKGRHFCVVFNNTNSSSSGAIQLALPFGSLAFLDKMRKSKRSIFLKEVFCNDRLEIPNPKNVNLELLIDLKPYECKIMELVC